MGLQVENVARQAGGILEVADRHGIPVVSPRAPSRRAGIVTLAPEAPGRVAAALANAGLVVTARGVTVRIAPHAGTDAETVRMLDEALAGSGNEMFISA